MNNRVNNLFDTVHNFDNIAFYWAFLGLALFCFLG